MTRRKRRPWHVIAREDWICGRHSGFRICDVLWYITGWHYAWRTKDQEFIGWYNTQITKRYGSLFMRPQYVPCPVCVLLKPRTRRLKKCGCYS